MSPLFHFSKRFPCALRNLLFLIPDRSNNQSLDKFSNRIEVSNMGAIRKLVSANCGISFLYEAAVASAQTPQKMIYALNFFQGNTVIKLYFSLKFPISAAASANCGISFLYEAAVAQELGRNILYQIPVDDFCIQREFNFVYLKNSIFSEKYDKISKYFETWTRRSSFPVTRTIFSPISLFICCGKEESLGKRSASR